MNTVDETRDKNPHFELLTGYLWKVKLGEKPSVEKEGQEVTQEVAEGSTDTEKQAESCDGDGGQQGAEAQWLKGESRLMERDIQASGSQRPGTDSQ